MAGQRTIGNIGNYYGQLSVKQDGGQCFWGIEDWDGTAWEPISKELFDALNKHQDALDKNPEAEAAEG